MKIRTKSRRLGTVTTIALALWLWGVPAEPTLAEGGAVVLPMNGAGDAAAEDGVSLRVPGQARAVVDASEPTGRVDLFVTPEADLTALAPRLELPDGFVADPEPGVAQDFSEPVTYTIEGDGERRDWRVRAYHKRYSYALAFDGSSVIEGLGDHDTYRFIHHPAEFTVSMRLRIEDRANRQAIFRTGSSASGQHHGLKIEQHSDGSPLRVTIYGNGSSSRVTTEVPGDHVKPDTWHHLAVTGAGHDEPMALYIDGERVDSTTIHTIDDEPQEYTLTLGGRYGGSSGFTGQLADVAIWNIPHSAEQIKQLAAEGVAAGQTEALVSHWPLNEVEGETAHDVVGGHEGVIRDAAWATSFEVLDARAERSVTGLKRLMPEMPAGARQQIVDMLAASEDPAALQGLIAATSDESASVREAACRALAGWDEAEAVQAVVSLLEDASASVREAAFATLTDMGSSAVEPFAAVLMESDSADARQRAAMRLGRLGGNAAVEALGQALTDGEAKVRSAAVASLSEHVAAGAADAATVRGALIERVHEDEVRSVRDTGARALARLGGDEAEAALMQAGYADWPMYRYDTSRRSVTPVGLGEALHLHWVREMPEPRRAWPRQQDDFEKLNFDKSYEPVVAGELMYVASMVSDSVKAYDINSGELRWRYRTDGPVRMAPLVWEGRVYAVADDGALHCVDAETGERIWWFQAAPTNRMVLGNERLISMWPGRGGPAIDDEGVLYFAAGIWPHEGVFIYAIDAETGEVEWANSGDASDAVVDSKRYYSFGGVAPQGQLVIAGDRLLVPGGRTAPAAFDRRTGEQLYFNIASHGTGKSAGGHEVFVHGEWFFNPRDRFLTHMYQVVDGAQYGSIHVDLATDRIFTGVDASGNRMYGYSPRIKPGGEGVPEPDQLVDRRGRPVGHDRRDMAGRAPGIEGRMRRGALGGYYDVDLLWRTQIDGLQRLHLKAGDTVYASAAGGRIVALSVEDPAEEPQVQWTERVDGEIFTMVAAQNRLFVVTEEGRIYCFGPEQREVVVHGHDPQPLRRADDVWAERAERMIEATEVRAGYAVMFGAGSGRLLEALLAQSRMHFTVFEPDAERVAQLRERFSEAGLYGRRVAVHEGDTTTHRLPPYIADLVIAKGSEAIADPSDPAFAEAIFNPLRPYGGRAFVLLEEAAHEAFAEAARQADLENAELTRGNGYVGLSRPGALPGSDTWTHQYADAANSAVSRDDRVKPPFGIAWFGGEPNHKTLPRHLHGPIPQVVEGRLILMGPHHVSARCVYTGIELWVTELPEIGGNFTSWEHEQEMAKPDTTVYFPNHPGANFIGAPIASAADSVYVVYQDRCLRLDAETGEQVAAFDMPEREDLRQHIRDPYTKEILTSYGARAQEGEQIIWGNIRWEGDYLIAAAYPHMFDDQQPGREGNWNATSSEFLVVMNRYDGTVQWVQQARYGFRHNAIAAGNGKVFVIDNLSEEIVQMMSRRGIEPEIEPVVVAIHLESGEVAWTFDEQVFGTSLSYSAEHDVLVQSGHPGRRGALPDEPRDRLLVLEGQSGDKLWAETYRQRRSPLGLHDTWGKIIGSVGEGAVDMFTGERKLRSHPMTDQPEPWTWTGALRCGTQNFSEHTVLFRSGAAGFTDLSGGGATGNIPGFRPGCTNNLVVADGMLNAPEYSRSCSCSYQLQTSLGLVHMPEAEMWTFNPLPDPEPGTIRRVGVNFGAPASRIEADSDVLWLEYPTLVGPAPQLPLTVDTNGEENWHRQHASVIEQTHGTHRWVVGSAIEGVRRVRVEGLVASESGAGSPTTYQVRLHFADLDASEAGERVFHVTAQGERVLSDFDVIEQAEGSHAGTLAEFRVTPDDNGGIELAFEPAEGSRRETLLSGVEVRVIE